MSRRPGDNSRHQGNRSAAEAWSMALERPDSMLRSAQASASKQGAVHSSSSNNSIEGLTTPPRRARPARSSRKDAMQAEQSGQVLKVLMSTENRVAYNLSLLKTSTDHLERDKCMYWSPVGASASSMHKAWPSSLRRSMVISIKGAHSSSEQQYSPMPCNALEESGLLFRIPTPPQGSPRPSQQGLNPSQCTSDTPQKQAQHSSQPSSGSVLGGRTRRMSSTLMVADAQALSDMGQQGEAFERQAPEQQTEDAAARPRHQTEAVRQAAPAADGATELQGPWAAVSTAASPGRHSREPAHAASLRVAASCSGAPSVRIHAPQSPSARPSVFARGGSFRFVDVAVSSGGDSTEARGLLSLPAVGLAGGTTESNSAQLLVQESSHGSPSSHGRTTFRLGTSSNQAASPCALNEPQPRSEGNGDNSASAGRSFADPDPPALPTRGSAPAVSCPGGWQRTLRVPPERSSLFMSVKVRPHRHHSEQTLRHRVTDVHGSISQQQPHPSQHQQAHPPYRQQPHPPHQLEQQGGEPPPLPLHEHSQPHASQHPGPGGSASLPVPDILTSAPDLAWQPGKDPDASLMTGRLSLPDMPFSRLRERLPSVSSRLSMRRHTYLTEILPLSARPSEPHPPERMPSVRLAEQPAGSRALDRSMSRLLQQLHSLQREPVAATAASRADWEHLSSGGDGARAGLQRAKAQDKTAARVPASPPVLLESSLAMTCKGASMLHDARDVTAHLNLCERVLVPVLHQKHAHTGSRY